MIYIMKIIRWNKNVVLYENLFGQDFRQNRKDKR